MSTDENHLERRASQRFDFQLPIAVRLAGTDCEGYGFTQDLSGRGVFFYTDLQVNEGDAVELTLVMPSEITLTENARVRCRGRVVRVTPVEQKFGVAARLEGYEYLTQSGVGGTGFRELSPDFHRTQRHSAGQESGANDFGSPGTSSLDSSGFISVTQSSATAASEVSGLPASTLEQPEGDRLGNR